MNLYEEPCPFNDDKSDARTATALYAKALLIWAKAGSICCPKFAKQITSKQVYDKLLELSHERLVAEVEDAKSKWKAAKGNPAIEKEVEYQFLRNIGFSI